jgi:hypothetical protein
MTDPLVFTSIDSFPTQKPRVTYKKAAHLTSPPSQDEPL